MALFFSLALTVSGCSSSQSQGNNTPPIQLTVSAAASLKDALTELASLYEKQQGDRVHIAYNFGGSGTLRQQIEQGAPVDLFISASTKHMKLLEDKKLIDMTHERDLLKNSLVLVTPKGNQTVHSFADLMKSAVTKIAIGTPASVPAGQYAQETFTNLKMWDTIKGKMVYTKDVRQALQYVGTGNVDAGVVYKTDALTSKDVKIVATAGESTHKPIIYPMGIIAHATHQKEAADFYQFLQSEQARKVFESYGFSF